MLGGIHFFLGSSLASSLGNNYLIAFFIGVLSHHLLDRLPHLDLNVFNNQEKLSSFKNWNYKIWLLVVFEFLFFLLISFYFIFNQLDPPLQKIALLGGIGAIFPDVFTLFLNNFLPQWKKFFNFYLNFHKSFHYRSEKRKIFLPLIIEFLVFLLGLLLFLGH